MCRFEYTLYNPCGCEVYDPRDARLCYIKPFWPTVVVRRTEELGDMDFVYEKKRYLTAKKGCKVKFPFLSHKEQKYTRAQTFDRGERVPCPWHDDMEKKWEVERTKQHPNANARKGSGFHMMTASRGGR